MLRPSSAIYVRLAVNGLDESFLNSPGGLQKKRIVQVRTVLELGHMQGILAPAYHGK
jgi:hypothetical protein